MKKILTAVLLLTAFPYALANAAFEGADHAYASMLVSENAAFVNYTAEAIRDEGNVSVELANLAADLIYLQLQDSSVEPDNIVWLLRILETSRDGAYREFVESIAEGEYDAKVVSSAQAVAKELRRKNAAYTPKVPDFSGIRAELLATKTKHPNNGIEVNPKAIRKRATLPQLFDMYGYPDYYGVRGDFQIGPVAKAVRLLEASWQNQVRVEFRQRGKGVRRWQAYRIHPLMDYENLTEMRKKIFSNDARELKTTVESLEAEHQIPADVYELFVERLSQANQVEDERVAAYVNKFCRLLRLSGDEQYVAVVEQVVETAKVARLKHLAASELFAFYAELNRFDEIRAGLTNSDPQIVRYAAARLRSARNYEPATLQAMAEQISANLEVEEPVMVNALALMCRTLGESGDVTYLPFLKTVKEKAASRKLQKYADAAIDKLG